MCHLQHELDCNECPYVTCNNHPQFYLALQCAMRRYQSNRETAA